MSLNKNNIVFLLLFLTTISYSATITGKIYSGKKNSAVAGAHIFLENSKHFSISSTSGKFQLTNVPEGNYQIVVSMVGFVSYTQQIKVGNEPLALEINLKEELTNLPELVVESQTLGGSLSNNGKLGGSIGYISPKQMQQLSFNDVNRALRNISGVYIQEEGGFGLRPNIGLRGSGLERSSKITLMEDGVLMAPAPYAAPAAYYFPTVGRMFSIEVLKGSSQISFGPQTTGGAINFVSTPIPTKRQARIHLIGGSFNGRNIHVNYGERHKHIGFVIEAFDQSSDGFKTLPNGENTGFRKTDYLAKLQLNTSARANFYQSLILKAGVTNENSNETYLGLSDLDFEANPYQRYAASANDNMLASQRQLSATHFIELAKGFEVSTTLYQNKFERNWYKFQSLKDSSGNSLSINDLFVSDGYYLDVLRGKQNATWGAINLRANNRAYFSEGIQTRIKLHKKIGEAKHAITLGGRIHRDGMDRFQWEDTYNMLDSELALVNLGAPGSQSNLISSAQAASFFLEYKFQKGNLEITPGLRHENITLSLKDFGKTDPERTGLNQNNTTSTLSSFIPGVSAFYGLTENSGLFAGVYKGFAPPGVGSNAKPESSINYELGYRQNNSFGKIQTTAFAANYSNLLGSDLAAAGGAGSVDLFNAGQSLVYGLEFEYALDFFINQKTFIPVTANYTYTKATFSNSFSSSFEPWGNVVKGDNIPYIPNHLFNFSTGVAHQVFSTLIQFSYNDEIRTLAGKGNPMATDKVPSFFVVDLTSEFFISESANIFFSIQNLLNEEYAVSRRPIGLRPGLPRNFRIGFKWNFKEF